MKKIIGELFVVFSTLLIIGLFGLISPQAPMWISIGMLIEYLISLFMKLYKNTILKKNLEQNLIDNINKNEDELQK